MKSEKTSNISLPLYYGLVIAPIVFSFMGAFFDVWFNDEERMSLDETFFIEPHMWELGVLVVLLVLWIITLIGLLCRKEWGRKLFIYTYIPSFILYFLPSTPWIYMSSIASLFYDIANMMLGMLLLVLVLPSLYQPIFNKTERI